MKAKRGEEFLESFFQDVQSDLSLNQNVVELLVKLQDEGKLTNANISNGLDEIRKIREKERENKINEA